MPSCIDNGFFCLRWSWNNLYCSLKIDYYIKRLFTVTCKNMRRGQYDFLWLSPSLSFFLPQLPVSLHLIIEFAAAAVPTILLCHPNYPLSTPSGSMCCFLSGTARASRTEKRDSHIFAVLHRNCWLQTGAPTAMSNFILRTLKTMK